MGRIKKAGLTLVSQLESAEISQAILVMRSSPGQIAFDPAIVALSFRARRLEESSTLRSYCLPHEESIQHSIKAYEGSHYMIRLRSTRCWTACDPIDALPMS